jgi:hypothetical protein
MHLNSIMRVTLLLLSIDSEARILMDDTILKYAVLPDELLIVTEFAGNIIHETDHKPPAEPPPDAKM